MDCESVPKSIDAAGFLRPSCAANLYLEGSSGQPGSRSVLCKRGTNPCGRALPGAASVARNAREVPCARQRPFLMIHSAYNAVSRWIRGQKCINLLQSMFRPAICCRVNLRLWKSIRRNIATWEWWRAKRRKDESHGFDSLRFFHHLILGRNSICRPFSRPPCPAVYIWPGVNWTSVLLTVKV